MGLLNAFVLNIPRGGNPVSYAALILGLLTAAISGPIAYSLWNYLRDPKSLRRFPAPSVAAFTPFWMIWHNAHGQRTLAITEAHRRLGPVVRIAPNSLSFSEPRAYKEIYGHGSPIIKDVFYNNLAQDTPAMADSTSKTVHSAKRRNVSQIFSAKNIGSMEPKVIRAVEMLLRAIKIKAQGGMVSEKDPHPVVDGEFDLRPWLNMFSFDAFTAMLWSTSYNFLESGCDTCHSMDLDGTVTTVRAMDSFQTGVHFNSMCAQLGPLAYRVSRWITQWTHRKRTADYFTGMARYGVVQRLKADPGEVDFFSFFPLKATDKRPQPMSVADLVAECTSFLNAGNDTTQISLTNVIFELASHPDRQQKLYDLLKKELPEESQPVASYARLSKIPYLSACIDETFRLLPPVRFGLLRRTVGEGSKISGHHIPGSVTVSASVYPMHRNEALFSEPLEWIPERWVADDPRSSEEERKNLREFVLPFTLGGRACIGRNLAYMELSICLAALVMAFEWSISKHAMDSFAHFERVNASPENLMVSVSARTTTWDRRS